MNKTFLFILVTLCLYTSCKTEVKENKAPEKSIAELKLSTNLNEYFTALAKLKKFNGGLYIKQDGKTIIKKTFHMTTDPKSTLHTSIESQFDIHSISKVMAKACLVKLEAEQKISKQDKLSKFIPDFPRGDEITIDHLLNNTAGLPRELSGTHDDLIEKTPDQLVELIKKEKLSFAPGTDNMYSNLGFQLIYYIISTIENKPFVQMVKDDFFDPLGMKDSGAHFYLDKKNLKTLVTNHEAGDDGVEAVPNIEPDGKNQAKIYSTLEDLMKFIDHVKEEPYASKLKRANGNIGWSGGGDGILSHANAVIKSNYEITMFSNYDEIPFGEILQDVEKIMTKQPYNLPKEINRKAVKLPLEIMERYVGKYYMKEFNEDEFEIRIENGGFVFYQNGEKNAELEAENENTLFADSKSEDCFVFEKDEGEDYKLIFHYKGMKIEGKKK